MSTDLIERVLKGEPRAIARAITAVENGGEDSAAVMRAVYPKTGNALIIGSIANIIVVEQSARAGVAITWRDHARYGLPITLLTLAGAGLALWLTG